MIVARWYYEEEGAWRSVAVDDPPPKRIAIPVVCPDGFGQIVLDLVATEHGLAVYR